MNIKQIIGLIVLAVGVLLVVFSVRSMKHTKLEKNQTQVIRPFRSPTYTKETGKSIFHREAVKKNHLEGKWSLIGGIALAIIGGSSIYIYRKK